MNHSGYLAAVVHAARTEGLRLLDLELDEQPRSALIAIDPAVPGGAFSDLQAVHARWDEHDGWTLTLTAPGGATTITHGHLLVPSPDVVAAWISLALTAPDLVSSRPGNPARTERLDDVLAAYADTRPAAAAEAAAAPDGPGPLR